MFSIAAAFVFIPALAKVVAVDNEVPGRCVPILEITNASQISEDSYEVKYNKMNNEGIKLGKMVFISDGTNMTLTAHLRSIEIDENNGTMYFSMENLTVHESYTLTISYEFDNGSCTSNVSSRLTKKHYACEPILEIINASQVSRDIYEIEYNKRNNIGVQLKKTEFISDETNRTFPAILERIEIVENNGTMQFLMENLTARETYTLIIAYEFENGTCILNASSRFTKMQFGTNIYIFVAAFIIASFVITSTLVYTVQKSKFGVVLRKVKNLFFPWYDDPHDTTSEFSSDFYDSSGRQEINPLYQPLEQCSVQNDNSLEFSRDKLELKEIIGVGEFGEVYYAKAYGLLGLKGYVLVAVKKMKNNPTEQARHDFLMEINTFKRIGKHKNIVEMLACVTRSEPYMIIMELIRNGNLKDYLLELRKIWDDRKNSQYIDGNVDYSYIQPTPVKKGANREQQKESEDEIIAYETEATTPILEEASPLPFPVLDHMELQFFASQIACGMAHLERIGITHRDLAARNILITKDKLLKITDFGMSRPGPYVNVNLERRIPLRWCSIEAIKELKTNNKSDVWSFGVVLWEIGTLGAFPYGDMLCNEVIHFLKSGGRLGRPEICTDELYDIMLRCWKERPEDRPSFSELVKLLDAEKRHVYVEFRKISPDYVFPEIYYGG